MTDLRDVLQKTLDAYICSTYWNVINQDDPVIVRARAALAHPAQAAQELTDAARDVLAERQRQVRVEGWTPEHDDEHDDGELAAAAACYALHSEPVGNVGDYLRFWRWASSWWKPKDRRSNLVRAGALILAEIERLDRAAKKEGGAV